MKVIGVSLNEVARIASEHELDVVLKDDGRRRAGMHIVLRPRGQRYAVVVEFDDGSEQRVCCYHGHQAFLTALYEQHPDARVITPIQTTSSRDEFLASRDEVRKRYLARYDDDPCSCPATPRSVDASPRR